MKTCTKCDASKPLDEFYRERRGKHGRMSRCKACFLAQMAELRSRPEVKERRAEWWVENKGRISEKRAANPHLWWKSNTVLRAKQFGFDITAEDFTKADVIAKYGDACFHCGGPFEEIDHWPVPISRGGHHVIENTRPSCAPCNQLSWRTKTNDPDGTLANPTHRS